MVISIYQTVNIAKAESFITRRLINMAKRTHRSPEEARETILDAAEKVIVKVGPAGLRISAVAKGAKMAHPNVLHHFGSREGLISAVAERVGTRSTERITTAISHALTVIDGDESQLIEAMTKVLGVPRQIARCSTGWWVGPSSPTPMLSWVITNTVGIFISAARRMAGRA